MSENMEFKNKYSWPAVFLNPDMDYYPDLSQFHREGHAIADMLMALGNMNMGAELPRTFVFAIIKLEEIAGVISGSNFDGWRAAQKQWMEKIK